MMAHAIANGVDPEDIQPDFGGRRTYDTCYRARHVFQVSEAVLVTQAFHLPRAAISLLGSRPRKRRCRRRSTAL